jgi:carbon-monoxide dehydrogenase medium subunit
MLKHIEKICFPESVEEASALLKSHAPHAVVMAGGTLTVTRSLPSARVLVDIQRLPLDYVKVDAQGLRIGARTTFDTLSRDPLASQWAGGLLAQAAAAVTSQLIRNAGTIGGDVAQALPYNNMPPALLVLGAQVAIAGPQGAKTFPLDELFGDGHHHHLGRQSLVIEFRLPPATRALSGVFNRSARACSDWEAVVVAAVALSRANGKAGNARIALGGVTRRARRFAEAERVLEGRPFTDHLAAEAADAVFDHLDPVGRRYKEYRREVSRVLVRRALMQAWEKG